MRGSIWRGHSRALLRRAMELDPDFARPTQCFSRYVFRILRQWPVRSTERSAWTLRRRRYALDENDARCRRSSHMCTLFMNRLDLAGIHYNKAIALNPSDTEANSAMLTGWLVWAKRARPGETRHCHPARSFPPDGTGNSRHSVAPEKALRRILEALQSYWHSSRYGTILTWPLAYAHLGRIEEARPCRRNPPFKAWTYSVRWIIAMEPYKNPADLEHLLDGLRKAGRPE